MRLLSVAPLLAVVALLQTGAQQTTAPSALPTSNPTDTSAPTTASPTQSPTTASPTQSPTTASPTQSPTTAAPTTAAPTQSPTTGSPSVDPTASPTAQPTTEPSLSPSIEPSLSPTASPSNAPTLSPTPQPSFSPTASPTETPSVVPSAAPTATPVPTYLPGAPTPLPTLLPTWSPSESPTPAPTLTPLPTTWMALGVISVVSSAALVGYRFFNPNSFTPFLQPVYGIRERVAMGYAAPICPPNDFTLFVLAQAAALSSLIVGAVWLAKPAPGPIEYSFVGILVLGFSLVLISATASALLEVLNCTYVFFGGLYTVFSSAYVYYGHQTNDPAALGCGIVLVLLAPAYCAVHMLKAPGMEGVSSPLLGGGDDHPYRDFKTQHGNEDAKTTSV